jgi:hypothetical protein
MNIRIAFFIIFSFVIFGCQTNNTANNKKAADLNVNTSVDSLGHIINLTNYRPQSAKWTVRTQGIANDRTPGPTDYILEALMTFDSATINNLKTNYKLQSVKFNPKDIGQFKFNWLPKDYIFAVDSGDAVTYEPIFFKSDSFLNGNFIVNKNDILLRLYTQ